ncbi:MAG: NAD(P)H-dependent oxidoreductase [Alphaproteobacteria bacterium]|nr:NAD(P)H-dependent oxidoreductase [Alphaproteobacteria bacterium]
MKKITILAGSASRHSISRTVAKEIAAQLVALPEVEAHLFDPVETPLPFYQFELDNAENFPATAADLRAHVANSDGLILVSPEYNSSMSAVLKNTIDWTTRWHGSPDMGLLAGKKAWLVTTSPGGWGGMRAHGAIKDMLVNIGLWVYPKTLALPGYYNLLNADAEPGQSPFNEQTSTQLKEAVAAYIGNL